MKRCFILYRRKRGGIFYVEDTVARKQESLGTRERGEALAMVNARNEAIRQPHLNLQIAKADLAGTDSAVSTRTWQHALDALIETKHGPTRDRWRRAAKESALDLIRNRVVIETQAEPLLAALKAGTVSTNVHLRKLHNFCLSMNWLPWPIIPKRLWPEVRFRPKRAITIEEHHLIIEREKNPERRDFYDLCWHVGDRATEFKQRCDGLGTKGISLHSYRYAWAERAKQCGYPERFAQEALGHNSKAVHRAYAKKAQVTLPPLEEYEKRSSESKVVPMPLSNGAPSVAAAAAATIGERQQTATQAASA